MGGRGNFSGGTFKTTAHKLERTGTPNSRVVKYKNGKKITERYYDSDGYPTKDIDYTDHGNPKEHPKVPHTHRWIGKGNNKKRQKEDK